MSKKVPSDPVHDAVLRQDEAALIRAISEGFDVNVRDRDGRTPLFYAVNDNSYPMTIHLLKAGSDVNARDHRMMTPLHFAAQGHRTELAKLLVENGAKVDARDSNGNTPLWRAVFVARGRDDLIRLLIASHANPALLNDHGISPFELAKTDHRIFNILKQNLSEAS